MIALNSIFFSSSVAKRITSIWVVIDLSKNWIQRNEYKYSLEQDSELYTDAGFTYEVSFDNDKKQVIAEMTGDRETLNSDIIYILGDILWLRKF